MAHLLLENGPGNDGNGTDHGLDLWGDVLACANNPDGLDCEENMVRGKVEMGLSSIGYGSMGARRCI